MNYQPPMGETYSIIIRRSVVLVSAVLDSDADFAEFQEAIRIARSSRRAVGNVDASEPTRTQGETHPPANPAGEVAKLSAAQIATIRDAPMLADGRVLVPAYSVPDHLTTGYSVHRSALNHIGIAIKAHLLTPTCNDSLQVAEQEETNDANT